MIVPNLLNMSSQNDMQLVSRNPHYLFTFVIIVFLFIPLNMRAQGYYPLEIGNVWEYYAIYQPPNSFRIRAVGDTVMQNGLKYTILESNRVLYGRHRYLRESGPLVYSYLPQLESEHLVFDFSKVRGDTVSIYSINEETIVTTVLYTGVDTIFGRERKVWGFLEEFLPTTAYTIRHVADSIGITLYEGEVSPQYFLQGAIIDGISYGTLSAIDPFSVFHPKKFQLFQNYPNPFNSSTIIKLKLPEEEYIVVTIFDIMGREVRNLFNGKADIGLHEIVWDGKDDLGIELGSGVYIYTVQTSNFVSSKKMILLR